MEKRDLKNRNSVYLFVYCLRAIKIILMCETPDKMKMHITFALAIAGLTCFSSAFCSLLGSSPGWKFFDELLYIFCTFSSLIGWRLGLKVHWIPCHRQCVAVVRNPKTTSRSPSSDDIQFKVSNRRPHIAAHLQGAQNPDTKPTLQKSCNCRHTAASLRGDS